VKHHLAERLRRLADLIDYEGSPKGVSWSFTFEEGQGAVFNQAGRGCPLWYLGDADYERAHAEAGLPAKKLKRIHVAPKVTGGGKRRGR
jgi:hypothetical protein